MHEFSIPFTLTECSECGAERPVSGSCSSCGSVSREVDPLVQVRTEAVARAQRISREYREPSAPVDLHEVWSLLDGWIDGFLSSVGALVQGPSEIQNADSLGKRIGEIKNFGKQLRSTPRLRPETAISRVLGQVVAALEEMTTTYLHVLAASTPEEAQQQSEMAQEALDRAAVLAGRVSLLLQRRDKLDGNAGIPDALADMAVDSFSDVQASDLLDFESSGGWLFERIADGASCPKGLGVSLNLIWAYVEPNLDPDRFLDAAAFTFSSLTSSAAIDGLISNENWRAQTQRGIS